MIVISFLEVQLKFRTSFSWRKMVATSLLSFFPLSSCDRMTVGEAWGDGSKIKEQLRSSSTEYAPLSGSLYGKDYGFRKGVKWEGVAIGEAWQPLKAPGT